MLSSSIAEFIQKNPNATVRDQVFTEATPHGDYRLLSNSVLDMVEMGLDHLPTSLVALPAEFTQVINNRFQDNVVRDVSHHLTDYFPNFFVAALYELQLFFNQSQQHAYIIGGITRDLLITNEKRYTIEDVDITVEGDAIEDANKLVAWSRNFDIVETFPQFGTAKIVYKNKLEIDLASTRREQYTACGALPKIIELGVPLKQDIIRRDFTVNALALSVSQLGKIIDCTSGLDDIEAKQLRVLKVISFFQDPSRIIRLLRFYSRLGFEPSPETNYLLDQFMTFSPSIYKGGGERIKYDLLDFLGRPESENKHKALNLFMKKGLHRLIDSQLPPELDLPLSLDSIIARLVQLEQNLGECFTQSDKALVYLSLILTSFHPSDMHHAIGRLGLTRAERESVEAFLKLIAENAIVSVSSHSSPSSIYHTFNELPFVAACSGVIISPRFDENLKALVYYYKTLQHTDTVLKGKDILSLGVQPGAQVKLLLQNMLDAKLDGQIKTRLDEVEWLKSNLKEIN